MRCPRCKNKLLQKSGARIRVRTKGPRRKKRKRRAAAASAARDPVARRAELVLQRALGTQVRIHQSADHTGEIRIPFHGHDDLARLLQLLGGDEGAETLSA